MKKLPPVPHYFIASAMMLFISLNAISNPVTPYQGEKREPGSFKSLDLMGAFVVTLIQSSEESVVIESKPEIAAQIKTKVDGGTLKIYTEKGFKTDEKIALTVNFKNLEDIECSGAIVLNATAPLKFENLSLDLSGACKMNFELSASSLDVDISGAGNSTLNGKASKVNLDISGAGKFMASSLLADDYDIDISGTGNAEVHATKSLSVEVSGTGVVKYKGDPVIKKEISGTGNVTRL